MKFYFLFKFGFSYFQLSEIIGTLKFYYYNIILKLLKIKLLRLPVEVVAIFRNELLLWPDRSSPEWHTFFAIPQKTDRGWHSFRVTMAPRIQLNMDLLRYYKIRDGSDGFDQ